MLLDLLKVMFDTLWSWRPDWDNCVEISFEEAKGLGFQLHAFVHWYFLRHHHTITNNIPCDDVTILTENRCQYHENLHFPTERNEIGVLNLHCQQRTAGKGLIECDWAGSPQRNESFVFLWKASGNLLTRFKPSTPSLELTMPAEMFEKQYIFQVGERTTPVILYGESLFYALSEMSICNSCQNQNQSIEWS